MKFILVLGILVLSTASWADSHVYMVPSKLVPIPMGLFKVQLSYGKPCFAHYAGVVQKDVRTSNSNSYKIAVGVLVEGDPGLPCNNTVETETPVIDLNPAQYKGDFTGGVEVIGL
jgi:hypothetical protein